MLSEFKHEVGRFLSIPRVDNASLRIANALRALQLAWVVESLELVLHLFLFSLLFLDLLAEVLGNLFSEDVLNSLVEELVVWLALLLEEFCHESVRCVSFVDSLLSDLYLTADLSEQSATRLGGLVHSLALNEQGSLLEVLVLDDNEAAGTAELPLVVVLDFLGESLENVAQAVLLALIRNDDVRIDHHCEHGISHLDQIFTLDEYCLITCITEDAKGVNAAESRIEAHVAFDLRVRPALVAVEGIGRALETSHVASLLLCGLLDRVHRHLALFAVDDGLVLATSIDGRELVSLFVLGWLTVVVAEGAHDVDVHELGALIAIIS